MEITGKIIDVLPIQEGTSQRSGKPWKKRYYIIETQETYPRKIAIGIFGEDRVNQYDAILKPGMVVTASVDIESREFNGRWYTDVMAWKFDAQQAQPGAYQPDMGAQPAGFAPAGAPVPPPPAITPSEPSDDLPF